MTTLFPDTSPEVERAMIDGIRALPAKRKMRLVVDLSRAVRHLALIGLRDRYPDAGEVELERRLADLLLGAELAARAYGPPARRR